MPRKKRTTVAGGSYHVFSRGNRRQPTYESVDDGGDFLWRLRETTNRFGWIVLAWCLMGNHDHMLLETPEDNLSSGMQWLKGGYAQSYNDRHAVDGHLYQGRFGSILVVTEAHMLELCRYIVLNPVRAGLCSAPEDWRWSSYAATIGLALPPDFLAYQRLLAHFGDDVESARGAFSRFVRSGLGESLPDIAA